jgi:hypothetical protein
MVIVVREDWIKAGVTSSGLYYYHIVDMPSEVRTTHIGSYHHQTLITFQLTSRLE